MASNNGSLNHEALTNVARFMKGLDELANETGVSAVGIVSIMVDGQSAGSLDCAEETETVWGGS